MSESTLPPPDKLENALVSELKALLAGVAVGSRFTISSSHDFCYSLELFLPRTLAIRFPEWAEESLDGFFIAFAMRTMASAVELYGTCILIRDQTVTPFRLELETMPSDGVGLESARIRLGELGAGELGISGPKANSTEALEFFLNLPGRIDKVRWFYEAHLCSADGGRRAVI